jgi:hypothetical protein
MIPIRIEVSAHYLPRLTEWHVHRVLRWLDATDLDGLGFIRLADEEPEDPHMAERPPYLRGFLYNGRYFRKTPSEPAHVVLYTRDLYFGIPRLLFASPMATLAVASTLPHEVGHHIIATRGYIYDLSEEYKPWRSGTADPDEERMANAYASDLIRKMSSSWLYKFGGWLARMLSTLFSRIGVKGYWDGNYQSAASLHFRAFMINQENTEASQLYRHDMEKLVAQSPSPLSRLDRDWLSPQFAADNRHHRRARVRKERAPDRPRSQ